MDGDGDCCHRSDTDRDCCFFRQAIQDKETKFFSDQYFLKLKNVKQCLGAGGAGVSCAQLVSFKRPASGSFEGRPARQTLSTLLFKRHT
jgi:hypothetical protein